MGLRTAGEEEFILTDADGTVVVDDNGTEGAILGAPAGSPWCT